MRPVSRLNQWILLPIQRVLRRKAFLALILTLSFLYCMVSLYSGRIGSSTKGLHGFHDYSDFDSSDRNLHKLIGLKRTGIGVSQGILTASDHEPQRALFGQETDNLPDAGVDDNFDGADGGDKSSSRGKRKSISGSSTNQQNSDTPDKSSPSPPPKTCRNSIQGRVLIADDRGYVCQRKDVNPRSGCCESSSSSVKKRYSCETCNMEDGSGCCAIYEYCISCCSHPNMKNSLLSHLSRSSPSPSDGGSILSSITDHFELCLAKCRTSSQSVQHENSYRDPKNKHCFGPTSTTSSPTSD